MLNTCLRELTSAVLITENQASQTLRGQMGLGFLIHSNRTFLLFNQYVLIAHCVPGSVLGLLRIKWENAKWQIHSLTSLTPCSICKGQRFSFVVVY